jgi:hypothetical protein
MRFHTSARARVGERVLPLIDSRAGFAGRRADDCAGLRDYRARQGGSLHAITALGVVTVTATLAATTSPATIRTWTNGNFDIALSCVRLVLIYALPL